MREDEDGPLPFRTSLESLTNGEFLNEGPHTHFQESGRQTTFQKDCITGPSLFRYLSE